MSKKSGACVDKKATISSRVTRVGSSCQKARAAASPVPPSLGPAEGSAGVAKLPSGCGPLDGGVVVLVLLHVYQTNLTGRYRRPSQYAIRIRAAHMVLVLLRRGECYCSEIIDVHHKMILWILNTNYLLQTTRIYTLIRSIIQYQ